MSLSHIQELVSGSGLERPRSLFAGGMGCSSAFVPDDILLWKSSSDMTLTDVSVHQRMILKIILSGEVISLVDGVRIPLHSWDMLLLFPFQVHSTQLLCSREEYSFLAITFTERGRDYSPLLSLKNRVLRLSDEDCGSVERLIRCWLSGGVDGGEGGVLALMELLLSQRRKAASAGPVERIRPTGLFDRICAYFRENFQKPISLKSVAAEFSVSEETIRRMFHESFGEITPGEMIRRLRMQQALELLEHTREPIGRIASRCGYDDAFAFSKAFKRMMGVSPLKHRQLFLSRM